MAGPKGASSDGLLVLVTLGCWVAAVLYVQAAPDLPADSLLKRRIGQVLVQGYAWAGWLLPLLFAVLAVRSRKGGRP